MNLTQLARVERLRSDAEMRSAEFFRSIPTDKLIAFASDVLAQRDLSSWMIRGEPEELLRHFAYATVIREVHRREEIAALED